MKTTDIGFERFEEDFYANPNTMLIKQKIPEEYDFTTEFSTWIIAYCPDTDSWFCTNQRFFYYEYPDEFQYENDAINYFRNHIPEFFKLSREMSPRKVNSIFLENTREQWSSNFDFSKVCRLKNRVLRGGHMAEYKQLRYDIITASLDCGIYEHPQQQMKKLGYNVIGGVPQSMGDCWWFTVEDFIEPLPKYLRKMDYNYNYWHGGCWKDCEHFKKNSSCCYGGSSCKKDI